MLMLQRAQAVQQTRTGAMRRGVECVFYILLLLAYATAIGNAQAGTDQASSVEELRHFFLNPPDNARIMMRWWWFGPAVEDDELDREMQQMKADGIGGFEIQPVYPLALDDSETHFKNLPYLSDPFLDAVRFANERAHELGLRVDMTLASGWPYGGSYVPVDHAAGQLRWVVTKVPEGDNSVPKPNLAHGESLLATFIGEGAGNSTGLVNAKPIPASPGLRQLVPPEARNGDSVVQFFISSRTGQQVKRAAVGAEGFVLDHFDRAAVDEHLRVVGDRLMQAFGSKPPYAVFSDSLEVYNSDWTPDLLDQFRKRRGYDLAPYLPLLAEVSADDELAKDIRHDWGQTLTELIDENYLSPIDAWARQKGTRFRSQTYGDPAVILSSNRLVELPEGEGPQWRSFSYTRWATSASHLYGRPITSAETWTWLHSPAFRATPLDMKTEADLFFLQGVNQLIGHGWPYSPPEAGEPGWAFYAAAVFNNHNPWSMVMPDVARYLQRASYMLRQGTPQNDVALLMPTDDAWASFTPGHVAVTDAVPKLLGPTVIPQILDAGFNLDYIDSAAIEKLGIRHRVLVLPGVERISLSSYQKIAQFAANGGIVVATRTLPSRGGGLNAAKTESQRVQDLSRRLFEAPGKKGHFVQDESQLGPTLAKLLQPDMALSPAAPAIGFIHRKLRGSDLYFVVNTSNVPVHTSATFRTDKPKAQWWDPSSGRISALVSEKPIDVDFAPYEARFLIFSDEADSGREGNYWAPLKFAPGAPSIDLSAGWQIRFPDSSAPLNLAKLSSWTEEPGRQFYSGRATYSRAVEIPESMLMSGARIALDFGPGKPVEEHETREHGTRALLESPIRDAALVWINGKLAGSVWHPPFAIDVTGLLRPGRNELRIEVGNTAINTLAGRTLPDYRLLNLRYGERFVQQDMQHLEPLPSGILGEVRLVQAGEVK